MATAMLTAMLPPLPLLMLMLMLLLLTILLLMTLLLMLLLLTLLLMILSLTTQQFPCFGMVNLTFMEKPFINFDFSLGKLELMSIGPGDMNVGNLVSDIIKNIITDLMVFPAVLPIPILDNQDVQVRYIQYEGSRF